MKFYHINPETGRVNICQARLGNCKFGGDNPHFIDRDEAVAFMEKSLANENELFPVLSKNIEKSFTPETLKKRLNLLPKEGLDYLIKETYLRSMSKKEVEVAFKNNEPFYVFFNRNQEMNLDTENYYTQRTFMRGACSVLAYELNQATGWDIVVFTKKDHDESFWEGHVAVKTPSGGFLDIEGENNSSLGEFYGKDYDRKTVTSSELSKLMTGKDKPLTHGLGILEKSAVSQLAYNLLESENYVVKNEPIEDN